VELLGPRDVIDRERGKPTGVPEHLRSPLSVVPGPGATVRSRRSPGSSEGKHQGQPGRPATACPTRPRAPNPPAPRPPTAVLAGTGGRLAQFLYSSVAERRGRRRATELWPTARAVAQPELVTL